MRIFLTGGTGVLGRRAVNALTEAGHTVRATARGDKAAIVAAAGGEPVETDLLDAEALAEHVRGADAVIRLATKIPVAAEMRTASAWEANDRLRAEGTRALIDAMLATGVETFVQESITFPYADGGASWIEESSPLDPGPLMVSALEAEAETLRLLDAGGQPVSLRFGLLYGPDASAEVIELVHARRFPIIGGGRHFVSSIHADDAARAIVAALDAPAGLFNVTDDEPLPQAEYARAAASALGAESPRRVPRVALRVMLGRAAAVLLRSHRISNRRFRDATGWTPLYPSAREGWQQIAREL